MALDRQALVNQNLVTINAAHERSKCVQLLFALSNSTRESRVRSQQIMCTLIERVLIQVVLIQVDQIQVDQIRAVCTTNVPFCEERERSRQG